MTLDAYDSDVDVDEATLTSRTPSWWRALPTTVQVVVLLVLMPGVVLHEATHATLAWPWIDVKWRWDEIAVDLYGADRAPPLVVTVALLGPTLIGWLVGVGVVLALLTGFTISLSLPVVLYAIGQWMLLSLMFLDDIRALQAIINART